MSVFSQNGQKYVAMAVNSVLRGSKPRAEQGIGFATKNDAVVSFSCRGCFSGGGRLFPDRFERENVVVIEITFAHGEKVGL